MVTETLFETGRGVVRETKTESVVLRMAGLLFALLIGIAPARVAMAQADDAQPAEAADAADAEDPAEAADGARREFKQLPVDEGQKRNINAINPILMAGKFTNGQQPAFDEFYQKYFLSRWTDPKYLTYLPSLRKELRISHLGKKSAGTQVHEHLNSLVLDFMKDLVSGEYHPAVQVNAMLMIGELNEVESPVKPLPDALKVLLEAIGDAKTPNAVRAAAMVGVQRQVAAKVTDPAAQRAIVAALLKLAADDISGNEDRDVREWILGQALETLGDLGSVGEGGAAFKAMVKAAGDNNLSLSTRAIAVDSLGRLNYANAAGCDAKEAATTVAQFIVDACAQELRKAKDSGATASRRMLQCLNAATVALSGDDATHKGIASLTKDAAQQARFAELQKCLDKATDPISKWTEGDDLESTIDNLQADVEEWVKKK